MAEYQSQLPADKVAIGWICTQWIIDIKDALKSKDTNAYMSLVSGLDNFVVQFKDKQYDDEIKKNVEGDVDKLKEANAVFRILMKLLQRAGFMPVRAFDEILKIPDDMQYIPDSKLKENDKNTAI